MIDFKTYLKKEDETSKETLRKFRREFRLYEHYFNLCSETIHYVCDITKEKPLDSFGKLATLIILPRIMQSLQSIRLLISKGYYYDALILQRSFMESVGLCAYLSLNEEEAENWMARGKIKEASIKLLSYVPKLLNWSDSWDESKRMYGILNDYVHSNLEAIATLFTREEPQVLELQFTSGFNEDKAGTISSLPVIVALMLREIFKNELTKGRKNRITKLILERFLHERAKSETRQSR